jgi:hypothetical protein
MLQLLKYNTIPYVRRTPYWPTKGNGFKKQKTLIPGMMLRLYTTSAGRLAVSGFANNATLVSCRVPWRACVWCRCVSTPPAPTISSSPPAAPARTHASCSLRAAPVMPCDAARQRCLPCDATRLAHTCDGATSQLKLRSSRFSTGYLLLICLQIGKPGYNLVCARSVVHVTDGVLLPIEPGM